MKGGRAPPSQGPHYDPPPCLFCPRQPRPQRSQLDLAHGGCNGTAAPRWQQHRHRKLVPGRCHLALRPRASSSACAGGRAHLQHTRANRGAECRGGDRSTGQPPRATTRAHGIHLISRRREGGRPGARNHHWTLGEARDARPLPLLRTTGRRAPESMRRAPSGILRLAREPPQHQANANAQAALIHCQWQLLPDR